MKIDIYGSRHTLIPILNRGVDYDIELDNVYIGSNLESQFSKVTKLNKTYIKNRFSNYDYLEQLTDFQKTFRRFSNRSENKVIVIDFMMESKEVTVVNNIRLTDSLLLKYSFVDEVKSKKQLPISNKFNNIVNLIGSFVKLLENYDLVVLNQIKLPEVALETLTDEELVHLKLQNSIIDICENLILKKCDNVKVIPFIYKENNFTDKYLFDKSYQIHVTETLNNILENVNMK